jgi:hypothetical protein
MTRPRLVAWGVVGTWVLMAWCFWAFLEALKRW